MGKPGVSRVYIPANREGEDGDVIGPIGGLEQRALHAMLVVPVTDECESSCDSQKHSEVNRYDERNWVEIGKVASFYS